MSSGSNYRRRGVPVKPQSRIKIRRLALGFRDILEIHEDYIDMGKLLEDTLYRYGVLFHVDDPEVPYLQRDEDACAFPDENRIVLTQSTYEGICDGDPRARFTLAHELGHLLLHGSDVQGLSRGHTSGKPHKAYCDSEWQADTFAAEFLMPSHHARGLTEHELISKFGVSFSAARIRKKILDANK